MIVIGVIVIIAGLATMFSAELLIRNALTISAVDASFGFDVRFDPSWGPIISGLYRAAQAEVSKSDVGLDDAFEQVFAHYVAENGYVRQT